MEEEEKRQETKIILQKLLSSDAFFSILQVALEMLQESVEKSQWGLTAVFRHRPNHSVGENIWLDKNVRRWQTRNFWRWIMAERTIPSIVHGSGFSFKSVQRTRTPTEKTILLKQKMNRMDWCVVDWSEPIKFQLLQLESNVIINVPSNSRLKSIPTSWAMPFGIPGVQLPL